MRAGGVEVMNWRLGECYCCCLYLLLWDLHFEPENNSFLITFQDIKFRGSKISLLTYVSLYRITYLKFLKAPTLKLIRFIRSQLGCNFCMYIILRFQSRNLKSILFLCFYDIL